MIARLAARQFYRRRSLRRAAALVLRRQPDLAHLAIYDETAVGPIQPDEALFLHGLIRTIRPATVVEIGFLRGQSALNFLTALDHDARLFSFDLDPQCEAIAHERFGHDPRFSFRLVSQTDISADHLDGRSADFVFLDAAHDLELNQQTFERLLGLLSPRAIVAVHDTGTIAREHVPPGHWWLTTRDGWIGDEHEVEPGERAFVNWLLERSPDFSQVHLHSSRTSRYGITLLQRSAPLARPG